MEFTECLKDRLTLTLKSGLLCAVMLMPATALAQSPEIVRGDELTPIATAVEAEDTAAHSTAAKPAEQRKITRCPGIFNASIGFPKPRPGTSCMKPSATPSATGWTRN
jgi:hypothetical protein